jgi:hypothetical protein
LSLNDSLAPGYARPQGNFVILPLFLQLARGLSPGEVGLIVFLRPGCGFLAGILLSRLIRRDAAPLTLVLRAGSVVYLAAWCAGALGRQAHP